MVILLNVGSRQDFQANLGARVGGGWKKGEMVGEKGEGEDWGWLGGMGWGGGRKDVCGRREVCVSTKGAILESARDLILEGFPGPRRGP